MDPRSTAFALVLLSCIACSKTEKNEPAATPSASAPSTAATAAATSATSAAPATPAPAAVPAGTPPPDGKYERVVVDGVTVPMINVMNNGAVVLVDTDGKKPRSWEEQYRRKRELPNGQFDVHKTNTNKNDTFEDDTIDKEGLWVIDAKGTVTRH